MSMIWFVIPVKKGIQKFWMPDQVRHDIKPGALVVAPPTRVCQFQL